MAKYVLHDIEWDADGQECDLPSVVIVHFPSGGRSAAKLADIFSDALSDAFGFCHQGFDWTLFDDYREPFPSSAEGVNLDGDGKILASSIQPRPIRPKYIRKDGSPVPDGVCMLVDHKISTFTIEVRHMNTVTAEDIKNLIQNKYEVVRAAQTGQLVVVQGNSN